MCLVCLRVFIFVEISLWKKSKIRSDEHQYLALKIPSNALIFEVQYTQLADSWVANGQNWPAENEIRWVSVLNTENSHDWTAIPFSTKIRQARIFESYYNAYLFFLVRILDVGGKKQDR